MTQKITVYTMKNCHYCVRAKELLKARQVPYEETMLDESDDAAWEALYARSKMKTVPQIFAGERLIGGYSDLAELDKKDKLSCLK